MRPPPPFLQLPFIWISSEKTDFYVASRRPASKKWQKIKMGWEKNAIKKKRRKKSRILCSDFISKWCQNTYNNPPTIVREEEEKKYRRSSKRIVLACTMAIRTDGVSISHLSVKSIGDNKKTPCILPWTVSMQSLFGCRLAKVDYILMVHNKSLHDRWNVWGNQSAHAKNPTKGKKKPTTQEPRLSHV